MEGNSKGWFPNGKQQFDYNFKNNLEHGVCTEWNDKGEKISEIRFDNGVPSQDLLTGQRIVTPSSPVEPSEEQPLDKQDETALEKVNLPPVPENEAPIEESQVAEEPKQQSSEANEIPSDPEVPNAEILPTADTLPTPATAPEQEIDTELPPPPPPPGEHAPRFDPFGDLPPKEADAPGLDKPEPVETNEVPSDLEVPNTEILPTAAPLPTPPAESEQEIGTELPRLLLLEKTLPVSTHSGTCPLMKPMLLD